MLKSFHSSLLAGTFLLCLCETGLHATESAAVRIDLRDTIGALIITGTERVSPVAEKADDAAALAIDGEAAQGWSAAEPNYDSTKQTDGWHEFKLNENGTNVTKSLLVLNGVAVHAGVLWKDETWDDSKIHVVRDLVRVPEGGTLTIADGAIVKFCNDAGIIIAEGGTLKLGSAVLTHIADDAHGDDTNHDGNSSSPAANSFTLTFNGSLAFIGDPEVFNATENELLKSYSVLAVNGGTVNRSEGHIVGAVITVTEDLELENAAKYYDFIWSSDQGVAFASSDATTTFVMPGKDLSITCTAELKNLEDNDQLSVLRIQPGWNLLTIRRPFTSADAERFLALRPMVLDADNRCYVRCADSSRLVIGAGYWLFSHKARTIVLEHDQSQTSWITLGLKQGWNLIGVADGSAWQSKASSIWKYHWQWSGNPYQPITQAELISGQAYWAKP